MRSTKRNHNSTRTEDRPIRGRVPRIPTHLFLCLAVFLPAGCGSDDPGPTGPVTRHVRPDGNGDFVHIQPCMDASSRGDTCAVHPGTYQETIRFHGRQIFVASTDGPEATTLDGGGAGTVVQFVDYETRDTVLDGFTIVNGNARPLESEDPETTHARIASGQVGTEHGGGIRILAASPVIRNCILRDNSAEGYGGGIFCAYTGSRPRLENVAIHSNQAGGRGGGLYVFSAAVEITNGLIVQNIAADGGGIAAESGARMTLKNSTLADNEATDANGTGAAAFRLFNSSSTWTDSILGNTSWDAPPLAPLVVLDLDRTEPSPGREPTLSLTLDHVNLQGLVDGILFVGDCLDDPNPCVPEIRPEVWEEDLGDPLFVSLAGEEADPMQAYYLSQGEAGQVLQSPCVNAGSVTAERAGLNTRTTQNGENGRQLPDSEQVDLGYHYTIVLP